MIKIESDNLNGSLSSLKTGKDYRPEIKRNNLASLADWEKARRKNMVKLMYSPNLPPQILYACACGSRQFFFMQASIPTNLKVICSNCGDITIVAWPDGTVKRLDRDSWWRSRKRKA